ncbi:polysaccharide biosynthesis/export family protein [Kistimonas asteriae]|uniref:polysaccharide biosynthesis/export family protein n=1 Tax=Kistimonas asteriae TaxID=517724 RepID=UPI001FE5F4E2|nr:polysaccharide biosynthesis/export family protein [Kistimonas asteriae]
MSVFRTRRPVSAMHPLQRLVALFCLGLLVVVTGVRAEEMSFSRYGLNSGDKVKVTIFGEEDMEVETRLSDAGTISYPFLDEIRVKGMTVGQLQNFLTKKLKGDYFIDPKVSVSITEYRKFFVSGEVKDPGGFSFEPGLTLEKAVALAGGFTQRASRKDIIVNREEKGKLTERNMKLDESILPGDIINVKESFF